MDRGEFPFPYIVKEEFLNKINKKYNILFENENHQDRIYSQKLRKLQIASNNKFIKLNAQNFINEKLEQIIGRKYYSNDKSATIENNCVIEKAQRKNYSTYKNFSKKNKNDSFNLSDFKRLRVKSRNNIHKVIKDTSTVGITPNTSYLKVKSEKKVQTLFSLYKKEKNNLNEKKHYADTIPTTTSYSNKFFNLTMMKSSSNFNKSNIQTKNLKIPKIVLVSKSKLNVLNNLNKHNTNESQSKEKNKSQVYFFNSEDRVLERNYNKAYINSRLNIKENYRNIIKENTKTLDEEFKNELDNDSFNKLQQYLKNKNNRISEIFTSI